MDTRRFVSEEIVTGLRLLLLLRLEGAPAKDTITLVGKTWIIAFFQLKINWTEDKDRQRIKAAFNLYLSKVKSTNRWPTPREIIDLIPQRKIPLLLKKPDKTPEEIEADQRRMAINRAKLKRITETLFENKRILK